MLHEKRMLRKPELHWHLCYWNTGEKTGTACITQANSIRKMKFISQLPKHIANITRENVYIVRAVIFFFFFSPIPFLSLSNQHFEMLKKITHIFSTEFITWKGKLISKHDHHSANQEFKVNYFPKLTTASPLSPSVRDNTQMYSQ